LWRIRALWRVSTQNPRVLQTGVARVLDPRDALRLEPRRAQEERLTAGIPVAVHGMMSGLKFFAGDVFKFFEEVVCC